MRDFNAQIKQMGEDREELAQMFKKELAVKDKI
jgi:hypothetical protein